VCRCGHMSPRRPAQFSAEHGFTLIEVLVVILIIGVLAAVAIPSFLNQKGKAYDASAKEVARTAQTTAETYQTDHGGEYTGLTSGELEKYETGLNKCPIANNACFKEGKSIEAGKGFEVVAEAAVTGDKFTIKKEANGEVTRSCVSVSTKTGCNGNETGAW
jgi:prepilin-type N-terminal cleavage/methylation domain-containing protein